jgi:hypothetical protein
MRVHVHETRHDDHTRAVYRLRPRRRGELLAHLRDEAVPDEHVGDAIPPALRVDEASAPKQ